MSGRHFASQFIGEHAVAVISERNLVQVTNLREFAGILCFDKWTGNCDGRQAIFIKTIATIGYQAIFIDQGFCFGAGDWTFYDKPLQGVYSRSTVYANVTGWQSFEPWLSRIEQFATPVLWEIAKLVPPEWYDGKTSELRTLVETIVIRRERVRALIEAFRDSSRKPFINWR